MKETRIINPTPHDIFPVDRIRQWPLASPNPLAGRGI